LITYKDCFWVEKKEGGEGLTKKGKNIVPQTWLRRKAFQRKSSHPEMFHRSDSGGGHPAAPDGRKSGSAGDYICPAW